MNDKLPPDLNAQNDLVVPVAPAPNPISIGPEGMTIISSVETIVPNKVESSFGIPEIVPNPENLKPPETNVLDDAPKNASSNKDDFLPNTPVLPNIEKKVEVVDIHTGKEKLHRIEQPLNDLTTKADLEEEDFIKHVEEIHTLQ